jgi:hypothetical protein
MVLKPPRTTLPESLILHCCRFADQVLDAYRNGENAASRAVSSHGAENNWGLQALGKMAEAALCQYLGIDPLLALHWGRRCDPGFDLIALGGHRIDVKYADCSYRYLIWPVNKRHIFHQKPFDMLVFVKADYPDFLMQGWTTKENFYREHKCAPEGHRLAVGTWYMDESELKPMSMLRVVA